MGACANASKVLLVGQHFVGENPLKALRTLSADEEKLLGTRRVITEFQELEDLRDPEGKC